MDTQTGYTPDRRDLLIDPPQQRQLLIKFLNHLLTKNHILMKDVLRYYRDRLQKGDNLRDHHFKQLIPYLTKYSSLSNDDCWDFHRSIIGRSTPPPTEPTNDLTRFFT